MYYVLTGIAGACVAIIISILARSNLYILAGLAPLFPTFGLFAHILAYKAGGVTQLREVALFGAYSIIPYITYIAIIYLLADKVRFELLIASAILLWAITAAIIYFAWNKT